MFCRGGWQLPVQPFSGHCIFFWHIFYAAVESEIQIVDSIYEHLWFFIFLFFIASISGILANNAVPP